MSERRNSREANDEQNVKTFVAERWTLEYDLAYSGMALELLVAARLAAHDDAIHAARETHDQVIERAMTEYEGLVSSGISAEETSSTIYALFHRKVASKAITAQYLVDILEQRFQTLGVSLERLEERLPAYLVEAIYYVTSRIEITPNQHQPTEQQTQGQMP
ncbi:hypothetical protein [Pseudomonas brassicae]|uniref:hypothetical protein n=1 Tax=Pseudomonas brassicae TaxID=2708063 RepID=UPI001FB565A8|nr:hypothetical protein [Pseudomonas brassicae]